MENRHQISVPLSNGAEKYPKMRKQIKQKLENNAYRQSQINTTQLQVKSNDHVGDLIRPLVNDRVMRFYHQNIRGAKSYSNWNKWKDGMNWMAENKVSIALLAETNTTWTFKNKQDAENAAKQSTGSAILSACSSTDQRMTDYQPGGTACILFNQWTGHNTEKITDKDGMGRWSGFKLRGKNKMTIIVLSAYRPTRSGDVGDYTSYSQQWRILRKNHQDMDPKPRETFMSDLIKLIKRGKARNMKS
jgi:hypothetical protein